MKIEKHNSRWFGVAGKEGKGERLEVSISNQAKEWEKVLAVRGDCKDCAMYQCCELSGCFSHEKITEKTQVIKREEI